MDALESHIASVDLKLVMQKKEMYNKMNEFHASMEASYKQFMDST